MAVGRQVLHEELWPVGLDHVDLHVDQMSPMSVRIDQVLIVNVSRGMIGCQGVVPKSAMVWNDDAMEELPETPVDRCEVCCGLDTKPHRRTIEAHFAPG